MKQLHSERFYLYRADKNSPMTVRLTLCMKDAVNGQMLREAVADTQKRYPYLCVRLCTYNDKQGCEHAAFDDNPLPWVIAEGRNPLTLMGSETNGHLLSFAWWDDCIAPITDWHETVHIFIDEEQMMAKIHACNGTPVVWLSLLLNKAIARQRGSASLSYVGKANLGAAEQYVRELRSESDTPYLVLIELAAVSGSLCLSFIQQFGTYIERTATVNTTSRI